MRYVSEAKIKTFAILSLIAPVLAACSLAPQPGRAVTITLPQGSGTATASRHLGSHLRDNGPSETSFSDFNCYAINVTAPDITNMAGVSCVGAPVGVESGFVSASKGAITISVPDGSARNFQLIGVAVPAGTACPSLSGILTMLATNDPNLHNATANVGQPYVLGSTTASIAADTAITINANFAAATSQKLFQGCDGGGDSISYPPTTVAGANQLVNGAYDGPTSFAFPFTNAPTHALDGSEFSSAATIPLSGATQSLIQQNSNSQPLYQSEGTQQVAGSLGRRAVTQLRWDATNWDLTTNPYASVEIAISGGIASGQAFTAACQSPLQHAQVFASVWNQTRGQWMPITQGNESYGSVLYWSQENSNYAAVPASELLMTANDGHKYIVVNAESNVFTGSSFCQSAVYVADAQVHLFANQVNNNDSNNNNTNQMWVNPVGPAMGNGCSGNTCTYTTAPGASVNLLVNNGVPPYHFSQATGHGTLDTTTGNLIPWSAGDTETIMVTDSGGNSQTLVFDVVDPTVVASISVPNVSVNGVIQSSVAFNAPVGSCLGLNVQALGFGYKPITLSAATSVQVSFPYGSSVSIPFNSPSTAGAPSSCGVGTYSPSVGPGTTWLGFYVIHPANGDLYVNLTSSTAPPASVPFTATAGAAVNTSVLIPAAQFNATTANINAGTCTPITVSIVDSYGNPTTNGAENFAGVDNFYISGGGSLYADAGCTTTLSGSTQPSAASSTTIYAKFPAGYGSTSGQSYQMNFMSASFTYGITGSSWPFTLFSSGIATSLRLSSSVALGSASGQCVQIQVQPTDSQDNGVTLASATSAFIYFQGSPTTTYSDPSCSVSTPYPTLNTTGSSAFYIVVPNGVAHWGLEVQASGAPYLYSNVLGF